MTRAWRENFDFTSNNCFVEETGWDNCQQMSNGEFSKTFANKSLMCFLLVRSYPSHCKTHRVLQARELWAGNCSVL